MTKPNKLEGERKIMQLLPQKLARKIPHSIPFWLEEIVKEF
jgi:hypothetical protein